jgi:hypothetical protein
MIGTPTMRALLWVGVLFNALVGAMMLFPDSLGALAALPPVGSVFYRWMLAFFVLLFAATYGWLALQPVIHRPLVALAAIGKAGVFVIALVCLARGDIQARTVLLSSGDLVFAVCFWLWLRSTPAQAP